MTGKKDDPQAGAKTQPTRRAVSRRAPAGDVADVKTTPARKAVARRSPAAAPVRPPASALDELLGWMGGGGHLHVMGRGELVDSAGTEGWGFTVQNGSEELCRLVFQRRGLLEAVVRSRYELENDFEWLRADGTPLGFLTVRWKGVELVDEADRVLWTMETGVFAELTRWSGVVSRDSYPDHFTVFEDDAPIFTIGRTAGPARDVTHDGELLGIVQGVMREGRMMRFVDGFRVDAPRVPAAHRLWMALAVAASSNLVSEYERVANRGRQGA